MKKLLFALTALAMIAVSCVSEIRETVQMEQYSAAISLTASTEKPVGTRSVVEEGTQVFWEPGDEVAVFAGSLSGCFRSDAMKAEATTTFWGSLGDSTWPAGQDIWAVYPYRSDISFDGNSVTTVLPSEQTARAGSFGKDMNLSIACSPTPSMQFYNVGGGIRFTVANEGITKIVLEGRNGEVLAGKVKVGFQEGLPAVLEVEEGSTSVTLQAPDVGFTPDTWYYVVVIPGTLEGGFNLSFYQDGAVAHRSFETKVTIKRGIFGTVHHADEGVRYAPDSDDNINFVDATVKSIVVRYFDTSGDGELSYREAAAVKSFLVAGTRAEEGGTSIFAGTGITTFDEIVYFTGLTKIEDGAFAGCSELKAIVIPDTVTEIGANAFKGCTQLQYVLVQSSTPPTVGTDAFSDTGDCPIYVPAGTVEQYTSAWSTYAGRIDPGSPVPDNEIWYTTTDGKVMTPGYARMGYTEAGTFGANLISNEYVGGKGVLTFDGPVTKIGRRCFAGNATLETLLYPKTVTIVRDYAFNGCSSLVSVVLPSQQTEIQTSTFHGCRSLESFVITNAIKAIRSSAFFYCVNLKRIEIPRGTTSIAVGAFGNCLSLSEIVVSPENPVYDSRENCNAIIETATNTLITGCQSTRIPSSVVKIANRAFNGLSRLYEVEIPEGVTEVGQVAFAGCPDLTRIVFPASVRTIGMNVISANPSLRTVVVASGNPVYDSRDNSNAIITTATNTVFAGCPGTTIPASVTSIGEYAFSECQGLLSFTIPEGVTSIGNYAFQRCSTLVEVSIPGSVTEIGSDAFSSCSSLTQLTISEGVKILGGYAFYSCPALIGVTLPGSVTTLGKCAFGGCSNLKEITIPANVTSLGDYVFTNCTGLKSITMLPSSPPQGGIEMFQNSNNFPIYVMDGSVDAYKVAQNWSTYANRIREIPGKRIYYTSSDGNIVTPANPDAFDAQIISNEYSNGQGVILFDGLMTKIGERAFSGCATLSGIQIPDTVTELGEEAFNQCSGLTELTLPSEVTRIAPRTFAGCSNLVTIVLPDGLTVIGAGAFNQCANLVNAKLPSSLTEIGEEAFSGCRYLYDIVLPLAVNRIGERAFAGCGFNRFVSTPIVPPSGAVEMFSGTRGTIYVQAGSEEAYKSAPYWRDYADRIKPLTNNVIYYTSYDKAVLTPYVTGGFGADIISNEYEDGQGILTFDREVTCIPSNAFASRTMLVSITIPEGVTRINWAAFYQCVNLKSISIPESVTAIDGYAFQNCTALTEVTLPENLTYLGMNAFTYCSSLKSVRIPKGILSLPDAAFSQCCNMKSVDLPNGLTEIGSQTFYDCVSLQSVTIPACVSRLGTKAFNGCYSLKEALVLAETPPTCGSDAFTGYDCTYPIYVPSGSVEAYKTASDWSAYADRIQAIP